jgi:RimJ/RimL family protein N-acetyltransferase
VYPEVIELGDLRLERWDAGVHSDGLAELCADPVVMEFLGGPMTAAAAEQLSLRIEEHWRVFGYGLWAAVTPDGRTAGFAGACRAAWHHQLHDRTEIGWRLARWAWGRGIATRGGAAGARAAFDHLGLDEVLALVHPGNARSLAVVQRLGMELAGSSVDRNLNHPLHVFNLRATAAGAER